MARSVYADAVDEIQQAVRPFLKDRGFRSRGRTFNRVTTDGLVQVVNLQMGPSDPPGTTYIPAFRENLHGLFTVNLGAYVPEVARHQGRGEARSWVQDYHCCVRARLERGGLPFLDRFASRDQILSEWSDRSENLGAGAPPRIVLAIILVERGETSRARNLLNAQVRETRNPGHPDYVRELAGRLGLGSLDG
jgi:uncharacterized protein DUF4304